MSINGGYPIVSELLAQYYVESGSDYGTLTAHGVDPFYLAVRSFDQPSARFWFESLGGEFKRNQRYPHGQTIAYLAVQDSDLTTVRMLFDEMHFDINVIPEHGYSTLGNATENATEEVFDYLLALPNINLQLRDQVAPFELPLHKACKQQDVARVAKMLKAMLSHNILLSPNNIKILGEKLTSKKALAQLLEDYLVTLKKHLQINTENFVLTPNYKALELLAYLDLWNIAARIDKKYVPQVMDGNKQYLGVDAVGFVINTLLPLIGFGMLPPVKLLTTYKTIKQLEGLYALPNSQLAINLNSEMSQALNQYSSKLSWNDLAKFKANDINQLVKLLVEGTNFIRALQPDKHTTEIVQALKNFHSSLQQSLEAKFPWVKAQDLDVALLAIVNAMQQIGNTTNLQQFTSLFEKNSLPKATKAFMLSSALDHPKTTLNSQNSHNTFKDDGKKKDLFDWFD